MALCKEHARMDIIVTTMEGVSRVSVTSMYKTSNLLLTSLTLLRILNILIIIFIILQMF